MGEEKFDVIVVGAGLAGSAAAYTLAQAGLVTVVVERGNYAGAKNVTGGRIYSHSLEKIFPDFERTAPVERRITKEFVALRAGRELKAFPFDPKTLGLSESASYSVLRGKFDQWVAQQAEDAGAMFVYGIRVDDMIVRNGKVCGIVASGEEMEADAVILAEGVNALLAQKFGMRQELSAAKTCVGAKEIIKLDAGTIQARFGVSENEGAEWVLCGDRAAGEYADGFIYTNRDSLSLGIIMAIEDVDRTEKRVPEMLEELKEHPAVAPLIAGGVLAEYSAHLLHRGSDPDFKKLYGDGVLIAGDAAGLICNLGCMVRGMDMAVESGRLAAEAVIAAKACGDYSAGQLQSYRRAIEESFIAGDISRCEAFYRRMWEE